MNKTKLGISTNLMAAFVFALAIVFTYVNSGFAIGLLLFATVAYVLCKEEDVWLKSCVVKAVVVMIVFMFVPFFFSFVDDLFAFLNFFFQFAKFTLYDKFNIMAFLMNIIDVFQKIFLLLLALMALKGKTIKVPFVDSMISKHIQ